MKKLLVAVVFAIAAPGLIPSAWAQPAAAPVQAAPVAPYSVQTTKIGTLLDTPALLVIFKKYLPEIVANPQVDEGRDLTLPEIVQYVPDIVTPEKLAAMDTELKAMPQQ